MEEHSIPTTRLVSPPALNLFSTSLITSEGIDSNSLFPTLGLGSVSEINANSSSLLGAADREQGHSQESEEMNMECSNESSHSSGAVDAETRALLDASEQVLRNEGGRMYVKDIAQKIIDNGFTHASSKALSSLESILYRETFRDGSRFKRIERCFGWFGLSDQNQEEESDDDNDGDDDEDDEDDDEDDNEDSGLKIVETSGSTTEMDPEMLLAQQLSNKTLAKHQDFKNKYYRLRKIVKQLVFENGAMADDITRTEAKLSRAKIERKFLLKRFFQCQAASEAGVLPPPGFTSLSSEVPHPHHIMPPSAPPERPKHVKPKKVARPKKPKEPKAAANLQQAPVNVENPGAQPRPASNTEDLPENMPTLRPVYTSDANAEDTSVGTFTLKASEASDASKEGKKKGKQEKIKQEKSKPSRPKPKKVKVDSHPKESTTGAVAHGQSAGGAAQDVKLQADGTPMPKPKRKKPGTAVKRKVQPIAVDPKGKPIFPIVLGGLTVHSLGEIVHDRPGFHSERYIWPVGYCSSRVYPSMRNPDKKCIYTCKILDGGFGPSFEMCPEDDPEQPITATSATACHCVVLKAVNKARGRDASNTGSGPEFFGFSHPTIQYLIQSLPGARKCAKYQWVKFELPKPQSKPVAGKLSSSANPDSTGAANADTMTVTVKREDTALQLGGASELDHFTGRASDIGDHGDEMFEDTDMSSSFSSLRQQSLTLASTLSPLSSPGFHGIPSPPSPSHQLGTLGHGHDTALSAGMADPMISSSPSRGSYMTSSLSMPPLSPTLGSQSPTSAGQGSFIISPGSPLFGNSSAFPESPK